jgi:ribosomal protein L12E/L44/L45/RPP1/RPP2
MSEMPSAAVGASASAVANGGHNADDTEESVELEQREKKIEVITSDEKQGCATFVIRHEDHTIGNSVRYILMKE